MAEHSDIGAVLDAVKGIHLPPARLESDVVDAIREALKSAGVRFRREVVIARRCRVDLLTVGGTAIEVKKGKPNTSDVACQVERYAASGMVKSVVLVSERGLISHVREAHGKPIEYVSLSSNWGIAL